MTIAEMHLAFTVQYDSVSTLGYPGFEPEEIDLFLNRSIQRFVVTRYTGNNVKGESFEDNQKRIEDLRVLVVNNLLTRTNIVASTTYPNAFEYTLPNGTPDPNYLFMVSCEAGVDRDECGETVTNRRIAIKQITHDQYVTYTRDPFNKPNLNRVLAIFEGNKVILITDGTYNVTAFYMSYLTYPNVVSLSGPVNCNLPSYTHQEIVDLAVQLCVAAVENPQRLQIEQNLSTNNE